MKNIFFAVVFALTLAACSKSSDSNSDNAFVGAWMYVNKSDDINSKDYSESSNDYRGLSHFSVEISSGMDLQISAIGGDNDGIELDSAVIGKLNMISADTAKLEISDEVLAKYKVERSSLKEDDYIYKIKDGKLYTESDIKKGREGQTKVTPQAALADKSEVKNNIKLKNKLAEKFGSLIQNSSYSLVSRTSISIVNEKEIIRYTTLAKDIKEEEFYAESNRTSITTKKFKILNNKEVQVNDKHKLELKYGIGKDKTSLVINIREPYREESPDKLVSYVSLTGAVQITDSGLTITDVHKYKDSDNKLVISKNIYEFKKD